MFKIADTTPVRFRALVLLAAFASLRWGEATALRRVDIAEGSTQTARQVVRSRNTKASGLQ